MSRNRTLVARRRYLGVDAIELQQAAHRVLARIVGLPLTHARVSSRQLRHDFRVDTQEGQALVSRLVAGGLVKPHAGHDGGFEVLPRMAEFAKARVVEPLSRAKAQHLVRKACKLAEGFNRETSRNPVAILSIAPCGQYLQDREELSQLVLGVVLCERPRRRMSRWRPPIPKEEGTEVAKRLIGSLSSYVKVVLVEELSQLPRPFSVAWQDPTL